MGRIGITYRDVTTAIATLQGQQKSPTVDNIRGILGTGSKSTIARHLREWKSSQGLAGSDPATLPSELQALINGLWERLQEQALAQTQEYQKTADAKVVQIEQQLHQTKQSERDLNTKIHTQEEQLHQLSDDNRQQQAALQLEQQEKIKLSERLNSLDARREESRTENERLHQLLKQVQHNLEHYQVAIQTSRQEQELRLEKQHHDYEQKISQLQTQCETLIREKLDHQSQYTQLQKIYGTTQEEHKTLVYKHNDLKKQYDILSITHQKLQEEQDQLSRLQQQQSKESENKDHAVFESEIKLKAKEEAMAILREELSKGEDKIQALRHDYQFASHEKAELSGQIKQLEAILAKKERVVN